jgi:hypothetical protein
VTKNPWDVLKQGANVTVDVPIGSKCHCGRFDLGRFVKAPAGQQRQDSRDNAYGV